MTGPWSLPVDVPRAGMRCGVEQEYQVFAGKRQEDFRILLDDLGRDLVCRDPGDPRARRTPVGVGLTADGWEAEVVTPTFEVSTGDLARLAGLVAAGRAELAEALSASQPGKRLTGFSTHVNVSVPDTDVVRVAEVFARDCAATLAHLVGPGGGSGVLVRPRRGRLEVGCDHLSGPSLLVAVAVVAGCVRGLLAGDRPPVVSRSLVVPSRERFGHFVPADGLGSRTREMDEWVDAHVRALVLPSVMGSAGAAYRKLGRRGMPQHPPRLDLSPRQRCGLRLSTAWLTWQHSVWSVHLLDQGRTGYAVMPAAAEPAFLSALDAGRLDDHLRRAVRSRRPRVLLTHRQIAGPAVWTDVRPGALVPAERRADGSVPSVSRHRAREAWRREDRRDRERVAADRPTHPGR